MPRFPSGTVPRAWRTVLRLAIAAHPRLAAAGLAALLRGKRVRGWNRLCLAAAEHPQSYAAWTTVAEPYLLPAPHQLDPGLIGVVLLGGDDAATRASLVAAFGPAITILYASDLSTKKGRTDWLLPIRAGDRVSAALGAVLARCLPACGARLVYWDEDHLSGQGRTAPWIKPDWDPLLFGAQDGLIGSCILRADAVTGTAVADWPALARHIADDASGPVHIPLILTHRHARRVPRGRARVSAVPVSVSVIVPTRDQPDLLDTCLAGLARTRFPADHEIVVVDNGSREPRTLARLAELESTGRARLIRRPGPFNFAALINAGVAAARSELVCLLNDDIEVVAADWLERMAVLAAREDVGAVGARLLYPDGAVQHAGVALGLGGAAGHVDKGVLPVPRAFAPWHDETRTVSAVTAACLLVSRARFGEVGGMDEQHFAVDFNDVDLCLRLAARGWRTIYCADATLIHHESRSRGTARRGAQRVRFEREVAALRSRWGTADALDPHHSPLFRRSSERCLLAF